MSKLKKFEDFSSSSENIQESLFDDLGGMLGKVIPFLGTGLTKTIKQKISAALLEKIGIKENSTFSTIIQEVVDSIELKEMPGLLTGENANADFLAPRLAQAVQEYIQRKGLDSLVVPLGIEPNGWMYSTIRESLQGELGKEKLTNLFLGALGSDSIGAEALSKLDPNSKDQLKDTLAQKLAKEYPYKGSGTNSSSTTGSESKGGFFDTLSSVWDSFTSGAKNS
jgi:hypothetical protein